MSKQKKDQKVMRGPGRARRDGVMSSAEQTRLAALARREGCPAARAQLIQGSMNLVASIAHRYSGRGLAIDDLISEGTIGLIQAIDRFDPGRGVRFSTFAGRLIEHAMQRAIGETLGMVRLPPKARRLAAQLSRESYRFKAVHGRPADPAVLALGLGIPVHVLYNIERVATGRNGTHGSDPETPSPGAPRAWAAETSGRELNDRLSEAVSRLTDAQSALVRLHFGLSGARPLPLRVVARTLGMGLVQARQELDSALIQLRRAMYGSNGVHRGGPT